MNSKQKSTAESKQNTWGTISKMALVPEDLAKWIVVFCDENDQETELCELLSVCLVPLRDYAERKTERTNEFLRQMAIRKERYEEKMRAEITARVGEKKVTKKAKKSKNEFRLNL